MRNYKKDFPIFQNNKNLVYLDSAATSQKPQGVMDAVHTFYTSYNSNIHRGLYPIAERATHEIEEVRKKVQKFINAKVLEEIIFTHGTTEAINIIAYGLGQHIQKGDSILISEMEHHSNIVPWQRLTKERNARLFFLSIDQKGELLSQIVDENDMVVYSGIAKIPNLKIVSLCHVSNVLGTINEIGFIGKSIQRLSKKSGEKIYFIVDAAQSIPHMKVDVQDLDCDFLVFSGHKMMAPTGTGVLYGREELLKKVEPFMIGSQMIKEVRKIDSTWADIPTKFEPGTLPIEGIIGLGSAIDYLQKIGMKNVRDHEIKLTSYFLKKMEKIDGVKIYGNVQYTGIPALRRSGVISFTIEGIHAHDIAQILGDRNICIRSGHHCAMPLHKRLGVPATARVSFYVYNTREDVDKFIDGLKKVKKTFSK